MPTEFNMDTASQIVRTSARYMGEDQEGIPIYTLSYGGKFYMATDTWKLVKKLYEGVTNA